MPRIIGGKQYFTLIEVARIVGVHRTTLIRWIVAGKVHDAKRDRHGWRLFGEEQVEAIKDFALYTTDPTDEGAQPGLFSRSTRMSAERVLVPQARLSKEQSK